MMSRFAAPLLFAVVGIATVFSTVVHAVVGAPILNGNQPVLASGTTVTLSWTAPTQGTPTSYLVEASSTPGGPANLANFNTGNTQTSLVVANVPAGSYYVRIRGIDASGAGAASNEVQLIVGGGVCPSAPVALEIASQAAGAVTLAWQAPLTGTPTSYVVMAGNTPGAASISFDTSNAARSLTIPGVPPGVYYIRLHARNAACAAPSSMGPASNEIQLTVGGTSLGAPVLNNNQPTQASGPTVTLSWAAPATGLPTSYAIEASLTPGGAPLVAFNTGSTQTSLVIPNVAAGTYYVRVRGVGAAGAGPASNEVALSVGATAAWGGLIECRSAISGNGYTHNETQRWQVGLPAQVVSGARTNYRVAWSAAGTGGNSAGSWTINSTATTDLSATVVASTGLTVFDRTTTPVVIVGGIVRTPPPPFDLYEMEFPAIVAPAPGATLVTGTWSRATDGGDSPQQPGDATGTLTCTWSLRYQ